MSASKSILRIILVSLTTTLIASTAAAQGPQKEEPIGPPKIIRKSGGVLAGEATERVEPVYPPLAKAARVSGAVVVEITIDEEGKVIAARAISGHPLLKDAAATAAQGWKFKPTTLSGVPVKVIGTITFNFNLSTSEEIEAIQEKIRANPDSAELYYKLGEAYQQRTEFDKAVEAFNQATRINPDYQDAYYQLGDIYERLDRKEDALQAYLQAARIAPGSDDAGPAHLHAGRLYFQQERFEEALQEFKQATGLRNQEGETHFMIGRTYLKLGNKEAAMREYDLLKRTDGYFAEALLKEIDKSN